MTAITVVRDENGALDGFSEPDKRAYARFKKTIKELSVGELFSLQVHFARSPKFHRLHFGLLKQVFEQQEQFADLDDLRKWLYVGAGECSFVPGPGGKMVALPKSIAWHRLDDADFSELHRKVVDFLRTEHAQRFLWPHFLDDERRADAMSRILEGFEQ